MINRSQNEIIKNWPILWEKPIVSVRCTTYNHEKYIAQALDSFLMQDTNFPFEIVVHDDASVDRTADIIREYEAKYPKIIKPIYETENQYSKRNGSLRRIVNNACRGKYIAFCEGDDYWCDSHKLQMQYEALEAHPECSLCTHIVQAVSEDGTLEDTQYPSSKQFNQNIIEQNDFAFSLIANHGYPFQTSSYFLRKKNLQQNESFFSVPGNGDEKILRICLNNGNVFFIPTVMSCYRTFSLGSWSSGQKNNKEKQLQYLQNMIQLEKHFDKISNNKFHKYIEISIKKFEILVAIIKKDFKKIFSKEYIDTTKKMLPPKKIRQYYFFSKIPKILLNTLFQLRSLYLRIFHKI